MGSWRSSVAACPKRFTQALGAAAVLPRHWDYMTCQRPREATMETIGFLEAVKEGSNERLANRAAAYAMMMH